MSQLKKIMDEIQIRPKTWLITGCAGFIGSNLLEALLQLGQTVVGIDNFSTGKKSNLEEVRDLVGAKLWERFHFTEGTITDFETCRKMMMDCEIVLHQAALGSVPRSIDDPLATHRANVDGFLNVLRAAQERNIRHFVYATSSSVYGDHPALPKQEEAIGKPLSPYALSKRIDEEYAEVFSRCYDFHAIGLRYFNVFGKRQDPEGPYAAVIPKWFSELSQKGQPIIFGDGQHSRDFCFVQNVVEANILAGLTEDVRATGKIYNIAFGARTTLNELFQEILQLAAKLHPEIVNTKPDYRGIRQGDIPHSHADISRARELLGYNPSYDLRRGLEQCANWYLKPTV